MYSYSSTNEFMECYNDNKLSEFNKRLYEDYVECNFNDLDFNNEFIDIKYKDGCNCNIKTDDNYNFKCCDDDINYYDDKFMHNKYTMFPKMQNVNNIMMKYFQKEYLIIKYFIIYQRIVNLYIQGILMKP